MGNHTKLIIKLHRTYRKKTPIEKKNHDFLSKNHFIL